MKKAPASFFRCSLCVGAFLAVAFMPAARAQSRATPTPRPGPPKVRVLVKENLLMAATGGGSATPAPATAPAAKPAAKPGAKAAAATPSAAMTALDAEKYTRTTKKSLAVEVVNLTAMPLEVNVKTTFLGKDESGKHEIVTETTQDKKLTLQPAKSESFNTDEVSFTHTTAHRQAMPPSSGGGKGKGGAPAPMIPSSGHAYFGYKVEVFEGNDLVGSTASEIH